MFPLIQLKKKDGAVKIIKMYLGNLKMSICY